MVRIVTYEFPQVENLPYGLSMEMFRNKNSPYFPGTYFKAVDLGNEYVLMFPCRESLDRFDFGDFRMDESDIICVKCKKVSE